VRCIPTAFDGGGCLPGACRQDSRNMQLWNLFRHVCQALVLQVLRVYLATQPQSTSISLPVMNDAASLARK
jgi:hypothetical protein